MKNKSCLIKANQKMQRPQSTIDEKNSQILNTSNKKYRDFYNYELKSQQFDFLNASKKSKETESTEQAKITQKITNFADQHKKETRAGNQSPTLVMDTQEDEEFRGNFQDYSGNQGAIS